MSEGPAGVAENGEVLAGLVNLIVVQADNKYFLGRHLSEWAVGAPMLEAGIACSAVAQAQMGHARVLYPLLEDLPSPVQPGPPGHETRRATLQRGRARRAVPDLAARRRRAVPRRQRAQHARPRADVLTVRQLASRSRRMLDEEAFHRDLASGRVRELFSFAKGPAALQERVDAVLPEMLCWFGPAGEAGVEALRGEGLSATAARACARITSTGWRRRSSTWP